MKTFKEHIANSQFFASYEALQECLKLNNQMPLDINNFVLEIEIAGEQLFNISEINADSKSIGTFDKLDIHLDKKSGFDVYFIKENNEIISALATTKKRYNGEEFIVVGRIWTHRDFRGKGYISRLHSFLLEKLKIKKLLSDDTFSMDSVKMYNAMIKKHRIIFNAYNIKTGEITSSEEALQRKLPIYSTRGQTDYVWMMTTERVNESALFSDKSWLGEYIYYGINDL